MMDSTSSDDIRLLDAWRDHADRRAMDQLVRRHIHFVYGAARRQVGADTHLAEDVTQAVFMLLMQKRPMLRSGAALAVWLHRATRYASANARRMRARQASRDRAAARTEGAEPDRSIDQRDANERVLPLLDDAIARLPARDRDGVILCFFQQLTYRQVGAALGTSEEAARKRVSRAIQRMREYFAVRGIATAGVDAIGACIAQQSLVAAPATLVESTTKLATVTQLAAGGTAVSSSTASIVKGAMHMMLMTQVKFAAAAACLAVVLGAVVTATAIQQNIPDRAQPVAWNAAASTAITEPYTVKVGDEIEVQLLGVGQVPSGKEGWTSIDGTKIAVPQSPFSSANLGMGAATKQLLLRITGPSASLFAEAQHATVSAQYILDGADEREAYWLFPFVPEKGSNSVDFELMLADGEWQRLCEAEHEPGRSLGMHETPQGGIAMTQLMESHDGRAMIYIAHEPTDQAWRVSATDDHGQLHPAVNIDDDTAGKIVAAMAEFNLPVDQVRSIVIETRPYNRRVIVKQMAVGAGSTTKPQVTVEDR